MPEGSYTDLSATALASGIRRGEISPERVMADHLARIERLNPGLNAVVALNPRAMDEARAAGRAVAEGRPLGPLHGIPVTIKDCLDVAGLPATRGSRIFADRIPDEDATAVRRLKAAGAIILGKTNAAEFGLWWETDTLVYGRTVNPWNPDRIAGGSSGGDAAAVAAGLAPLGIGSDLAGSIRVPAHFCGAAGLKATHGAISTHGHWPLHAPRYWHVGPIARHVEDLALAYGALAGFDPLDPYSLPPVLPRTGALPALGALRIGLVVDGGSSPVAPEIRTAVSEAATALRALGCRVEEARIPTLTDQNWNELAKILMGIEGSMIVGRAVRGREGELHPFIRQRLQVRDVPLTDYIDALEISEAFRREMAGFFLDHDLLLMPVCATTAFEHGATELTIDGQVTEPRHALRAAVPWDISGHPALAVPFALDREGMPVGVQLVGRKMQEDLLFLAGTALEAAAPVRGQSPSLGARPLAAGAVS
ncbi:MAG: amidase [Rhodobacteraceae bacterium]|jgi:Asp-tRNA(Asn)/Glu-tRNA(Gln) amidotransferase A subunit family amidase|nr:amidase [Paracoccaceae bacterium]